MECVCGGDGPALISGLRTKKNNYHIRNTQAPWCFGHCNMIYVYFECLTLPLRSHYRNEQHIIPRQQGNLTGEMLLCDSTRERKIRMDIEKAFVTLLYEH